MSWLIDPAQRVLIGALGGLTRRQELISSNLANIDTPGYRPSSIDFESALQAELRQGTPGAMAAPADGRTAAAGMRVTDPRHLGVRGAFGAGGSIREFQGTARNDRNAVDLETEMTALTESQMRYSAVSRLITGKHDMINDAIGRGR